MASFQAARNVSESRRERETFRYDPSLIAQAVHNDVNNIIPPSELRSSPDAALTAFAELGVLRLNATRALISLFDSKYQYIVAEATPALALTPNATQDASVEEQLFLCGTAVPRSAGICEIALAVPPSPGTEDVPKEGELPVTVISDMAADPRAAQRPFCRHAPQNRFYAGVPIRTQRGINIGVFCVFDNTPRESLDDVSARVLRDLSHIVMDYLDTKSNKDNLRRSDRMVRGVGSFVEGKTTMSGWRMNPTADSFKDNPSLEGVLNQNQQQLQQKEEEELALEEAAGADAASPPIRPQASPLPRRQSSPVQSAIPNEPIAAPSVSEMSVKTVTSGASGENIHRVHIQHVFSKAANVIREAIEVESVLFLDASIGSFGGLAAASARRRSTESNKSTSSSSDEKGSPRSIAGSDVGSEDTQCRVLGFSTSSASSIDGRLPSQSHASMSERFLNKLLRRYPEGKIFNFDETGSIQSSDFSGDDVKMIPTPAKEMSEAVLVPAHGEENTQKPRRRVRNPFSRKNEGNMLSSIFSGARSIAVVPLWDVHKQRWFAGGFACTKTATRVLTIEGELSYLRAFSAVVMSEVDRINTRLVNKAKTDLLSSLSHELRSPLHGIILGTELLRDTPLDAFQGETLVSVENCGRTLLETIDHLLDWSKINNFIGSQSKRRRSSIGDRGLRGRDEKANIEAGMMSISSNVEIDVLAEEVVDSVCAGFSYQRMSVAQLANSRAADNIEPNAMSRLDSMQAMEDMASSGGRHGNVQLVLGDVSVNFDISPAVSWTFHTQPGAIRRIIMNLLGNSLKYTSTGFVNVNVLQSSVKGNKAAKGSHVEIIITDSGKGISEDYLQNHLFTPFAQEDSLSAGTGLGLSLVHQIVVNLGGSIDVWSKVNRGTRVTVRLPLHGAISSGATSSPFKFAGFNEFQAHVAELRGLRVRFLGFPTDYGIGTLEGLPGTVASESDLLKHLCSEWLRMYPIDEKSAELLLPDLMLSTDRHLDQLLYDRRHGTINIPIVVICRNALAARQLSLSPRFTNKNGVFEFISQPIGPRKLAKVLLLSFRRWTKVQAGAIPTPTAMSLVTDQPTPDVGDQGPTGFGLGKFARSPGASSTEAFVDAGTPNDVFSPDSQISEPQFPPIEEQLAQEPPSATEVGNPIDAIALPDRSKDVRPSTPHPAPAATAAATPGSGGSATPTTSKPGKPRFIIVDDNPLNLRILASYVKKLGHKFDSATDGRQAVESFRKNAGGVICILMDISMPVMDGFEATRRIRAHEKAEGLPRCNVFALTGLASAGAQQEAFASGIDLFLTKPVRLKELSKILETRGIS
ncbi:putative histidine kinase 3 [Colletotrichum gloeosporioides]|uniref:histidine kinase n=1 Tax=Colletotrichum gloeosporioides TaxID=474922 RepID=A0A8H4CXD6_COLGL|nr:putative histidine kinase 3 [Colletotrichum gloeosporioides]KAF3811724.1 putative histidine kinase 3 [Colletotrichum gloeosporioides]